MEKEEATEMETMREGETEEDTTMIAEAEMSAEDTNEQIEEIEAIETDKEEKEEKEDREDREDREEIEVVIEAEIETIEVSEASEVNIEEEEEAVSMAAASTETSIITKSRQPNKQLYKRKTKCPFQRQEKVGQNATSTSSVSSSA